MKGLEELLLVNHIIILWKEGKTLETASRRGRGNGKGKVEWVHKV